MQLITGGILETLGDLISGQNADQATYTTDVLGLLESLFPATENKDGVITFAGTNFMLGNDQVISMEAAKADPRMEKF